MAVIDAHAHIYPDKIASRAVDAVGDFYLIDMFGEGTVEHLLSAQQHAPITHFIVHSVATTPGSVESINNFIAEQCRQHPEFIGFMAVTQSDENARSKRRHHNQRELREVRQLQQGIQQNLLVLQHAGGAREIEGVDRQ